MRENKMATDKLPMRHKAIEKAKENPFAAKMRKTYEGRERGRMVREMATDMLSRSKK